MTLNHPAGIRTPSQLLATWAHRSVVRWFGGWWTDNRVRGVGSRFNSRLEIEITLQPKMKRRKAPTRALACSRYSVQRCMAFKREGLASTWRIEKRFGDQISAANIGQQLKSSHCARSTEAFMFVQWGGQTLIYVSQEMRKMGFNIGRTPFPSLKKRGRSELLKYLHKLPKAGRMLQPRPITSWRTGADLAHQTFERFVMVQRQPQHAISNKILATPNKDLLMPSEAATIPTVFGHSLYAR
ncbi:hypothetical protein B0H16DRAFT_1450050 [Mycena metata]|uniref:Uncharacterized protein n=1 Tax=Mycena metata TaxID=1033252 RepID=A0AAD7NUF4_9AGAR|nr:hypothetical protein B0H16DRAFT_1450050 [Mycena metata]